MQAPGVSANCRLACPRRPDGVKPPPLDGDDLTPPGVRRHGWPAKEARRWPKTPDDEPAMRARLDALKGQLDRRAAERREQRRGNGATGGRRRLRRPGGDARPSRRGPSSSPRSCWAARSARASTAGSARSRGFSSSFSCWGRSPGCAASSASPRRKAETKSAIRPCLTAKRRIKTCRARPPRRRRTPPTGRTRTRTRRGRRSRTGDQSDRAIRDYAASSRSASPGTISR